MSKKRAYDPVPLLKSQKAKGHKEQRISTFFTKETKVATTAKEKSSFNGGGELFEFDRLMEMAMQVGLRSHAWSPPLPPAAFHHPLFSTTPVLLPTNASTRPFPFNRAHKVWFCVGRKYLATLIFEASSSR